MESKFWKKVIKILGKNFKEIKYPVNDEMYKEITTQIIGTKKTLHEVSFGAIPKRIGNTIQKLIQIEKFIEIAYIIEGKLFGTSLLAMEKDAPNPSKNLLENIALLVAVSLRRKQAEKNLVESEKNFQNLFKTMTTGFAQHEIICDKNGRPIDYRFLKINPAFKKLTGFTDEILGKTVREILPHIENEWIEKYGKVALTEESISFELFNQDLNKYFNVTSYAPKKGQFACIFTDITEQKQLENFKQLSLNIHNILNETSDSDDAASLILEVIQKTLKLDAVAIRLENDEKDYPYFTQQGFSENFLETENSIIEKKKNGDICRDENNKPYLECTCGLVISGKTEASNLFFTTEGTAWKNNSLFFLDIPKEQDPRKNPRNVCIHNGYKSMALIPIKAKKKIIGLLQLNDKKENRFTPKMIHFLEKLGASIGVAFMRKKDRQEIQKSKKRFQDLVRLLPQIVFEVDNNGVFNFLNDKSFEIFDYSPEEIEMGLNIFHFLSPEDHDRAKQGMSRVMHEGSFGGNTYRFKKKDGSFIYGIVSSSCLRDENKNPIGIRGIITDITNLKKMEDQLRTALKKAEDANYAKTLFFANMSHEIRTPLNRIIGFATLLKEDPNLPSEQKECAEMIYHSGYRLLELLNNVLDVAKIDIEQIKIAHEPFDLEKLLLEMIKTFRLKAREQGTELEYCYSKEMNTKFKGDSLRMNQIISNLLSNAVKFTSYGKIKISVWSEEKKQNILPVFIEIQDTGIGIPSDKIEHIFDRFYQVEDILFTRNYEGARLGLALVNDFIHLLNGSIQVKSRVGEGSTFTIFLPLEINFDFEAPKNQISRTEIEVYANIFVVEDDFTNQRLLQEILKKIKCKIEIANNGKEAIKKLSDQSFCEKIDLILMDIKMPMMNGFETTEYIRKMGIKIPIIAITAQTFTEDKEKCRKIMNDYISKPFELETLKKLIEKWVYAQR